MHRLLWIVLAGTWSAAAADWPQLLGPSRNGISTETNLAVTWPASGPRRVWRTEAGSGWSGPVVADGVALHSALRNLVDNALKHGAGRSVAVHARMVRLAPTEAMPVGAFIALCAAARRHGNGIMEVTTRGSLQIRGLTPRSRATIS